MSQPMLFPPPVEPAGPGAAKKPPMLTQYLEYKERHHDSILFFQVGDFYELFFQDAVLVSRLLNLTLTTRDKNSPDPVPMAGVPCSAIEGYIERLVALGYSCALVSQVGEGAKGVVIRKLERMVTPGVRLLGGQSSGLQVDNLVVAIRPESESEFALAWADPQAGQIMVRDGLSTADLYRQLQRLSVAEIVVPLAVNGQRLDKRVIWVKTLLERFSERLVKFRGERQGGRQLASIRGYSSLAPAAQRAVRLLVDYVDEVTVSEALSLREVVSERQEGIVSIDATTRRNLELIRPARDGVADTTLYGYLNRTVSPGGARLLRDWVLSPSAELDVIVARQSGVRWFLEHSVGRSEVRRVGACVPDIERIAARLELGVVMPRELAALRDALEALGPLRADLERLGGLPAILMNSLPQLHATGAWWEELRRALHDRPAQTLQEGGLVRDGFDSEVDRLRKLRAQGSSIILELEAQERSRTGINSLKIRFNNLMGYFIEVTKTHADKVPAHYQRRQQTVSADRFTTEELRKLEQEVVSAEHRLVSREQDLYNQLKQTLRSGLEEMRVISRAVSLFDVMSTFAEIASADDLVVPTMLSTSELTIDAGRHPIIARLLSGRFVPNSVHFGESERRALIVTGPNMGGKSTYLRQVALIVLMAQMGSYVPARSARIGIVDRVFARLGASDNQAEGESTFMVEMREVSYIVAEATRASLVLIDEVGRGTATADGVALARAILEWLVHEVAARTLFATHFHELTDLATTEPSIANLSVGSYDKDGEVIFTHEIKEGPASRSHGIEVAKLAGIPVAILERARGILEAGPVLTPAAAPVRPVTVAVDPKRAAREQIGERVLALRVNELTPVQALLAISELQGGKV